MTPGIGFLSRFLMYFSASLQCCMNSAGRAMLMSFDPRTAIALRFLSPMMAPTPRRLALERPCSMEAKKTLCSPARPMEETCDVRVLQLLADQLRGLERAQAPEVRGVADLHLVVVDPQIDQLRGLAANDHLVVAGVLQLRSPEAAHHREGEQPGLRRDGGDDGAIAAGSGRAGQQTGAEDEQVLGIEGLDLGADPVPHDPGVGAQPAQMKLGQPRVGGHPLDVSPGQIDFQVEACLCVPHSSPLSSSLEVEATYPSRKSAVCCAARSSRLTRLRSASYH